ncbi:hypothetical protein BH24DEI1_BH24DEI1_04390 [soil metagenome]
MTPTSAAPGKVAPGRVVNRAGLRLPRHHYHKVVVGGGLLGLACACYLRRALPQETLLVVEGDGIPSEGGASYVSPGLAHRAFGDEGLRRRAAWAIGVLADLVAETGIERTHDRAFRPVGWARLGREVEEVVGLESLTVGAWLSGRPVAERGNPAALLNLAEASHVLFDPQGGYGSAEAAALSFGHGAVGLGADLLINGRAGLVSAGEIQVERLEFNRAMRREVVKTERVTADAVVIAAGVGTAALIEEGVGVTLPLRKSYNQYPRLEASPQLTLTEGRVALPVVEHLGFSLRTQGEGVMVVPPPLPPDPEGYQPRGGQLVGVRVGLRRELLEELMERLESMPFLAWETLNLGKTASGVRGAWDVHTPSGLPEFFEVRPGLYALAGGREGLTLGLAAALDLAGKVANQPERPWQ